MKKRIVITAVLLVIGIALCAVGGVICGVNSDFTALSNVTYTEHTYNAESSVNAIDFELKSCYNFIIRSGESCSLKYSESDNSNISVTQTGGVLKVVEKRRWSSWLRNWFLKEQKTDLILTVIEGTVLTIDCDFDGEVNVELPAWEYGDIDFEINGNASISTLGDITTKNVDLDIAGRCEVYLSGKFNNVEIDSSGSSSVNIEGSAASLSFEASGSSKLESANLKCAKVDIEASGSVESNLKGEGGTLRADTSGSCRIYAAGFTLATAEIYASGSVRAEINVSDRLAIFASGAANIDYYGDPQIQKSVSGVARINKVG